MTAIVGIVHEGNIIIGGDSAGVSRYSITSRADGKVFRRGPFLMGFTTSFRMGQLLQYSLTAPDSTGLETDVHAFMATKFIDAVRACLKEGGFARKNDEVEHGGTFLVGYRGRLFTVEDDYQVGESAWGYDAVGSGFDAALGSLFTSQQAANTLDPADRARVALEAAAQFNAAVRPPFTIQVLEAVR